MGWWWEQNSNCLHRPYYRMGPLKLSLAFAPKTTMIEKTGPDAYIKRKPKPVPCSPAYPHQMLPTAGADVRVHINLAKLYLFDSAEGETL